jgi:hypothetical protein
MAELAPTEETPFKSEPVEFRPMPVMRAEAWPQLSHEDNEEKQAQLAQAMTPADRDAILKAYGHYAEPPSTEPLAAVLDRYSSVDTSEERTKRAAAETAVDNEREAVRERELGRDLTFDESAAARIRNDYGTPPPAQLGMSIEGDKRISLGETEDRMKFVSTFTQSTGDDERDSKLCGATAIVAGMVLANGEQGVDDIIGAIAASDPESAKQLEPLRKKLAQNQGMSEADFIQLKSGLADHLDKKLKSAQGGCNDRFNGADPGMMQKFINENDSIKKTFADNRMSIDGVDRQGGSADLGDGNAEHAVLTVRGEDGKAIMVYDPNTRKETAGDRAGMGPQIIQDRAALADYEEIRTERVRPVEANEKVHFDVPRCKNPPR